MKSATKWLGRIIFFFIGAITCYFTTQYEYFEIDTQLNVLDFLVAVCTTVVAIYIAYNIQKGVNKNQNQYIYLEKKLDDLWMKFNEYSKLFNENALVELSDITSFTKDIFYDISFMRSIFEAFEVKTVSLQNLESKIDEFEQFLTSLPMINNRIPITIRINEINSRILEINLIFKALFKTITDH